MQANLIDTLCHLTNVSLDQIKIIIWMGINTLKLNISLKAPINKKATPKSETAFSFFLFIEISTALYKIQMQQNEAIIRYKTAYVE